MKISKIDLNVEQKSSVISEATKSLSSNPFGVSFKGSVIQADVFESSKPNAVQKVSSKSKMFVSAIVGNINNFNSSLKSRMNAVVSFGRKIKADINEAIEKANNFEVSLDIDAFKETFKNKVNPDRQYKVKNLMKRDVGDLKQMLEEQINA